MIISNCFVRTYFFGSKVARIHNKSFQCCVSTAKEGLFQKQSTIILEPKIDNTVGAGAVGLRPCGKIIYSPSLRKGDRFQFHDGIAKTLDALGEEGCTLEEALEQIFADLKRRGIAVATMNLAADQGQADAQYNLGDLYDEGRGMPQDYAQAAAWPRKAAEQGDAVAQGILGLMYVEGQGVPQDYAQAVFWLRKSAEQDLAPAQYNLGLLYDKGLGIPQDHAQAALWFRKAAEQGDADAQYHLGFLFDYGEGVPQDFTQAAEWYRKAAEQGNAKAQFFLGNLYYHGYYHGKGVPKDFAEAYFWLDVAAVGKLNAQLVEKIVKDRHKAASQLTPTDQSRVQQRVRKWFEAHQAKP